MAGAHETPARRRAAPAAALPLLLLAASAPFAFFESFGSFRYYDDEGVFLLMDRHLAAGHALYDEIWSYYGPLPHQLRQLLHAAGALAIRHDAYRWLNLAIWLGSAALMALGIRRLSGSRAAAAFAYLAALLHLLPIAYEPAHPQEFVVLLLAALPPLAARVPAQPAAACAGLGVLVAGLALAKVNAGAFAAAALALALALASRSGALRSAAACLALLAALALPGIAMGRDALGREWSALALSCTAGVLLASALWLRLRHERPLAPRAWACAAAGALAALAASLGALWHHGSSLAAIARSQLELPAELTRWVGAGTRFFVPLWVPLALAALAAGIALRRAGGARAGRVSARELVAAAKLGLSLSLAAIALLFPRKVYYAGLLFVGVPALGLLLVPTRRAERAFASAFPRLLLALAASLQALYAYPVTGSQLAVASWPALQCAVLLFADAWSSLAPPSARGRSLARAVPASAALLLGLVLAAETRALLARHRAREPLGLPGTRGLRLGEQPTAALRWLAHNARAHCDFFLAIPGLNSLYFWTGIEAPLALGSERWFLDRDASLRGLLLAHERPCLVTRPRGIDHWFENARDREAPLAALVALRAGFAPVGEVDGWRLLLPLAQQGAPLEFAARVLDAGGGGALELCFPLAFDAALARVSVVDPRRGELLADSEPGGQSYPLALSPERPALAGPIAERSRVRRTRAFPGDVRDALDRRGLLVRLYGSRGERLVTLPLLASPRATGAARPGGAAQARPSATSRPN